MAGGFTRSFLNPPFSQDEEPERDFLDAAMDALEPEGMLAAIVYAGIFADDPHRSWRENFLRKHSLLAVISMPEDLFYPTAAPTSIVVARAHVPQRGDESVLMARVWNDGFEKLKSRRVERPGSQLPEIERAFEACLAGSTITSELATAVLGSALANGEEWSPQQWLPQPHSSPGDLATSQHAVFKSVFQAVASMGELADEVLSDFTQTWASLPDLPFATRGPVTDYFTVSNGKSTGEKNYADGTTPYISSGDTSNSIIRLIAPVDEELFADGGLTVTAFGTASLQPWAFVGRGNGGSAVRVLTPRFNMSVGELLWFAAQINVQKWRFFYARMSIKSRLGRLILESPPGRIAQPSSPLHKNLMRFRDSLDKMSSLSTPT